jgi:hypothetical protein
MGKGKGNEVVGEGGRGREEVRGESGMFEVA